MPLLEVDDLRTHFFTREGVVRAVDGVSFSVEAGRTLGIVGESGCGKSVTALSIVRLLPTPPARIVSGSIRFDGRELTTLSERELEDVRGRQIAMVFQDPMTALNPTLTIGTQLTEVLERHLGLEGSAARRRAAELLDEVGIIRAQERLDDYPHHFSGGMRQRVVIAMAIACEPRLLIADEPTTALDVTTQAQILDLLQDLQQELGMAIMLITHDLGVAAQVADEVAVMYLGKVVEVGPTAELWRTPAHPYSEALIGAIPSPDGSGRLPTDLRGEVPDPSRPPSGCRFRPRCPHAFDRCVEEPPLLGLRGERSAACWLQSEGDQPERPSAQTGHARA
jgi:oligopeptide transport system ATP-binding protein